jgi:hypothetical protein
MNFRLGHDVPNPKNALRKEMISETLRDIVSHFLISGWQSASGKASLGRAETAVTAARNRS